MVNLQDDAAPAVVTSNHMKTFPRLFLLTSLVAVVSATPLFAATTILDDFEVSEGHFTNDADFSGTTQGETVTDGPSTADLTTTTAYQGTGSQQVFLDDDPASNVANPTTFTWQLRHLSGGGTVANNVGILNGGTTWVGYYLMTSTPNLQASLMIDDGTGLERAAYLPIVADGGWHLYEWELADTNMWEAFAGTGQNGEINAATVTLDSIFITALDSDPANTGPDQDATFFVDAVAYNTEGRITVVPEPSGLILAGLTALGALSRRRREG